LSLQNGFLKIKFENKFFHNLTFYGLAVGRYEAPTNLTDKLFIKITLFVFHRRPTAEQAVVMYS
jgi:hypothetical protein